MRKNAGFTLIELMITVAVIGILAAVAIPIFQGYVIKTQINRVISETGQLRMSVEGCLSESRLELGDGAGECNPGFTGSNLLTGAAQVGVVPAGTGAPQVSDPLRSDAAIVATFGNNATPILIAANAQITWTRDPSGSWTCAATAVPINFLSSACP